MKLQVWHEKDPSQLKVPKCRAKALICSLLPTMVTSTYVRNIFERNAWHNNQSINQYNQTNCGHSALLLSGLCSYPFYVSCGIRIYGRNLLYFQNMSQNEMHRQKKGYANSFDIIANRVCTIIYITCFPVPFCQILLHPWRTIY